MSYQKVIESGMRRQQGFLSLTVYHLIREDGSVVEFGTNLAELQESADIHNANQPARPKKRKCGYADKYMAKVAPKCGCATCEDIWNRRFMGGTSTLIGNDNPPYPWQQLVDEEVGMKLGEVHCIGSGSIRVSPKPIHTLDNAQKLLSTLQPVFTSAGFYVALAGSVIYSGVSYKDFDLVAVPSTGESVSSELIRVLTDVLRFEEVGLSRMKSRGRPVDLYHYRYQGYNIDLAVVSN